MEHWIILIHSLYYLIIICGCRTQNYRDIFYFKISQLIFYLLLKLVYVQLLLPMVFDSAFLLAWKNRIKFKVTNFQVVFQLEFIFLFTHRSIWKSVESRQHQWWSLSCNNDDDNNELLAQNLSSPFIKWIGAVVRTITPRDH